MGGGGEPFHARRRAGSVWPVRPCAVPQRRPKAGRARQQFRDHQHAGHEKCWDVPGTNGTPGAAPRPTRPRFCPVLPPPPPLFPGFPRPPPPCYSSFCPRFPSFPTLFFRFSRFLPVVAHFPHFSPPFSPVSPRFPRFPVVCDAPGGIPDLGTPRSCTSLQFVRTAQCRCGHPGQPPGARQALLAVPPEHQT